MPYFAVKFLKIADLQNTFRLSLPSIPIPLTYFIFAFQSVQSPHWFLHLVFSLLNLFLKSFFPHYNQCGLPKSVLCSLLLKTVSVESMMPSNHLIFCHPLLLLLSIFPSIRVCSSESALCIRWPRYWSIPYLHLFSNVYFSGFDIVIFDTGIILFLNSFCRFSELIY